MLTDSEYATLRTAYNLYHAELDKRRWNYVDEERAAQLPPAVSNDDMSRIEVYEFMHDTPARYFAYVKAIENKDTRQKVYPDHITTWTGEFLGRVIDFGYPYRSNMGDWRVNIKVKAINNRTYTGTYFYSSGDYCRLRITKD